jgi:hypothetical protein
MTALGCITWLLQWSHVLAAMAGVLVGALAGPLSKLVWRRPAASSWLHFKE